MTLASASSAVLFDDTNDWTNGAAQVAFINRIDDEFVKEKGDVRPLIVVAARYNSAWGPSVSYFRPYMADLHSDIQIMWTGAATMSNISREVYEWPEDMDRSGPETLLYGGIIR